MVYKIALFLALHVSLFATSFEQISKQPMSLAKDYYIFTFLQSDKVTPKHSRLLMEQVSRMNNKLFYQFGKTSDDEGVKFVAKCMQNSKEDFLKSDIDCKAIRLNPSLFLSLNESEQTKVKAEILKAYPTLFEWLHVITLKDKKEILNSKYFLYLFTNSTTQYRQFLDQKITKTRLIELSRDSGFESFMNRIIMQNDTKLIQESLLKVFPEELNVNFQVNFWFGINAVEQKSPKIAEHWFENSAKLSRSRYYKDRAIFWQYLTTNNQLFLKELSRSFDINIYTITALEKLGLPPHKVVQQHDEFKTQGVEDFKPTNPFEWVNLQERIFATPRDELYKKMQKLETYDTMPYYYYLAARMNRGAISYFIVPYAEHLELMSNKEKAMVLAIAKQESRFIPSVVSTSYALGMMQFMDFTANSVAKRMQKDDFTIDMLFDPQTAYELGNYHLNELLETFGHPVFVAYAYNGGAGFTRRMLERKELFCKKGRYEPWLSLERVPIAESREYGKYVVANYVVYLRSFGEKVSMGDLLQKLIGRCDSHQ